MVEKRHIKKIQVNGKPVKDFSALALGKVSRAQGRRNLNHEALMRGKEVEILGKY